MDEVSPRSEIDHAGNSAVSVHSCGSAHSSRAVRACVQRCLRGPVRNRCWGMLHCRHVVDKIRPQLAISARQQHTRQARMKAFYRQYLLVLLMVILAFNYVDRLALGLVLQDIKKDFSLSDTQLGLLSGIAFALFYSLMGLPIARWADRGNRVTIITLTTGLWSVAVA